MSRAKEIQEKLDLQAKLQVSFNKSNLKVLSWLNQVTNGSEETHDDDSVFMRNELLDSKKAFLNLPLVQTGSGINFSSNVNDNSETGDISTIGDFINSDKKINTLAKQKTRAQKDSSGRDNIYRIAKDDTKAMISLKRKMRKSQRNEKTGNANGSSNGYYNKSNSTKDVTANNEKNKPNGRNIESHPSSSDDDDEDEMLRKRTTKKSVELLFNSKKKKGKS